MRTAGAARALALLLLVAGAAAQVYSTLLPAFRCVRQDVTCATLGDFYAATRGQQWRNNSGWAAAAAGTVTDYCTLPFITCNATTGAVTKVCVLVGSCATARSDADAARRIMLANRAYGTLPPSLSALTNLTRLCVLACSPLGLRGIAGPAEAAFGRCAGRFKTARSRA